MGESATSCRGVLWACVSQGRCVLNAAFLLERFKYKLQMLDWETEWAGSENWDGCIVKAEQDCLDPQPSSYTESEVHTVVTDRLVQEGGVAVDYLKTRVFPGEVMNEMLVYMNDQQATGEDAAYYFLETYEDIWSAWVGAEEAAAIKSEL